MHIGKISAAGADGYKEDSINYYNTSIRSYTKHDNKFNLAVADAIKNLNVTLEFVTPSAYDRNKGES